MSNEYQHTQIGYLIIILLGAAFVFILAFIIFFGFNFTLISVLLIFILCFCLLSTLTIAINDDVLIVKFGVGVICKKFNIKEIDSCRVVKNSWYYGWGIRLIPDGWLFNVSGFDAVEISLYSGKKYRIGTDEPEVINKVISKLIKKIM